MQRYIASQKKRRKMLKLVQLGAFGILFCLGHVMAKAQFVGPQPNAKAKQFEGEAIYRETAVYGESVASPGNDVGYDIFGDDRVRLAQNTNNIASSKNSVLLSDGPNASVSQSYGSNNAADRSLLQGITLQAEWVPQLEEDSLAQSNVNLGVKLGMPMPFIGGPLLVTHSYGLQLLDGPTVTDVPARLHELQMSFATFQTINPRWMITAILNLGVYGDDYSLDTDDAFRTSGFLMGVYTQSPTVQWVFGVAALNRDDIPVIPIIGVTIDHDWVRYELTFPRPKIAWKLPGFHANEKRILYVGGDLGGGAWAVQRTTGMTDTLNLSRYGLLIGYEHATSKRKKISYELGYLFNRQIEFEKSGEEFDLDDSLFARINWSF